LFDGQNTSEWTINFKFNPQLKFISHHSRKESTEGETERDTLSAKIEKYKQITCNFVLENKKRKKEM
jgi:hypothetical protein